MKANDSSVFEDSCHTPQNIAFTAAEEVLGLDSHEAQHCQRAKPALAACLPRNGKLSHQNLLPAGTYTQFLNGTKAGSCLWKVYNELKQALKKLSTSEEVPDAAEGISCALL